MIGSGSITEEIKGTKKEIINQIYNITNKQEAINDFMKLKQLTCADFENNKVKLGSRVGAGFVDFFTAPARMETRGNKGLNFWEMLDIKEELKKKKWVVSFFKHYKETNQDYPTLNIWWRIFNMYYGAINQFKPVIAMNLYCKYKPTSILDMTMGWGGRLVGACALNIPKYTGIDLNPDLEKPYAEMVKTLKPMTTTQIKLMFKDALKVDYSKIDYDMVFTSPPYYNIEIYKGTEKQSKEDWDNKFYEPLFRMTWKYLKRGGHYCLNVPNEVYERVCVKLFGKADEFIPFPKALRTTDEKYKEYIYVWNKKEELTGTGIQEEFKTGLPKATFKNEWVVAKKSNVAGYGVFAKKNIPSRTKIADFIGDEMTLADFKKKYGGSFSEQKDLHQYSYLMRRVNKVIVAYDKQYISKNITNYVNEIPPDFNVELKDRALWSIKEIPKGKELSLEYHKTYHRYWLKENKEVQQDATDTNLTPHIKKILYDLTPVNKVGKNWFKRDDYFEYAGQKGGKVRSALYLIAKYKPKGITTAGNKNSPQINIVSSIGDKMNIPVVAFTTGQPGTEVKLAETKGAIIKNVDRGYETVLNARARDYSKKQKYLYVPFGMDTEEVHHLVSNQVRNIPKEVKRIVVPVGSASSLIGIIKGVKEYRPDIKILGVVVGAKPLYKLKKYVPDWKNYATLKYVKEDYSQPATQTTFNNIELDPFYEAKTIPYIKDGDLLWIVGVREGLYEKTI